MFFSISIAELQYRLSGLPLVHACKFYYKTLVLPTTTIFSSALTGDPLYQWTSRTPTDLIKNGKCEQFFTVADDKRKHKDQSKLIDRCSDALNEYAKKHMYVHVSEF